MDLIQSIVLGIIQGITEFLPVSSSGHLVVFQKLLGIENHDLAFDVAAHLGTLLTVFTFYFKTIKTTAKDVLLYPLHKQYTAPVHLFLMMFVASLPTAIIGLTLKDHFEALFSNINAVGVAFLITGLVLFLTRKVGGESEITDLNRVEPIKKMKIWQALVIGFAQSFAITPGISRSGSTIAAGLFVGMDRNTSALFSFMISIPAVLGAGILQLKDISVWDQSVFLSLGTGFLTAYFSGLVGLWGILKVVKKGKLQTFSLYLWLLGSACILGVI